ncbi:hypothetical protein BVW01_22255, partial [Mycobacterium tuberculosis]
RVAELVAQLVESASFMRATENGGSRHQFVVNCDYGSPVACSRARRFTPRLRRWRRGWSVRC